MKKVEPSVAATGHKEYLSPDMGSSSMMEAKKRSTNSNNPIHHRQRT